MYICEACKKKPATVHIADIHEGKKRELHLCQDCAEKQGINFHHNFTLSELVAHLTQGQPKSEGTEKKDTDAEMICNNCGLTYREFQARGRLGCAEDYKVFRAELLPMIERIHGKTVHVGKVPNSSTGRGSTRREIIEQQKKMRDAISEERYEEAASIRDHINNLKRELENES